MNCIFATVNTLQSHSNNNFKHWEPHSSASDFFVSFGFPQNSKIMHVQNGWMGEGFACYVPHHAQFKFGFFKSEFHPWILHCVHFASRWPQLPAAEQHQREEADCCRTVGYSRNVSRSNKSHSSPKAARCSLHTNEYSPHFSGCNCRKGKMISIVNPCNDLDLLSHFGVKKREWLIHS